MSNEKNLGAAHEFITLADLFGVLRARLLPIILAALLCGVATFGITCIMPKEYSATSSYYVRNMSENNSNNGVSSSQTAAAQAMAQDFANVVLRSDKLLENAIEKHDLDCTLPQLRKMLETEVESKSAIFYVTVTSSDPELAQKAARAIEDVLPATITEIAWGITLDPNAPANKDNISCVAVLQKTAGAHQSAPRYKLLTALGTLAGAMIAYVAFLLLFLFGSTVRNEEDLSRILPDYPIVGRIPHWGFAQTQQDEEDA